MAAHRPILTTLLLATGVPALAATTDGGGQRAFRVQLRTRENGDAESVTTPAEWDPAQTAIIVCDMWDSHHCLDAKERVAEMAPFMNEVLKRARRRGALIIHAPSDCMDFYADTPQRRKATEAPFVEAPGPIAWQNYNPEREAPLPVEPGCDGDNDGPRWTRQIAAIEIGEGDAVSDNGQEVYNLLAQQGIEHVIIMGVHTNVCVLGRPFGIRQMVYHGIDIALCRDLTDTYHRDPGRHFKGLRRVIEHVEAYWCPTITSTDITGMPTFRFAEDDTAG